NKILFAYFFKKIIGMLFAESDHWRVTRRLFYLDRVILINKNSLRMRAEIAVHLGLPFDYPFKASKTLEVSLAKIGDITVRRFGNFAQHFNFFLMICTHLNHRHIMMKPH